MFYEMVWKKLPTSYYLRHVGEGNIFGKKTTRRIIQKVDEEMLPMLNS